MSVPVHRNALPKVISATDGYAPLAVLWPPTIAIEGVAEKAVIAPARASARVNLLPLRFMRTATRERAGSCALGDGWALRRHRLSRLRAWRLVRERDRSPAVELVDATDHEAATEQREDP